MVERFLYGLDESIQNDISMFAQQTVIDISRTLLAQLEIQDPREKVRIEVEANAAEKAFVSALKEKAFAGIRSRSRAEIEDMVEFMPKPEMATMAEALVNLTSIKRKVSRGFETVGGPIDVAVISQSEGFIWVKRKHYFQPELNARYLARVRSTTDNRRENHDAPPDASRQPSRSTGRRVAAERRPSKRPSNAERD